MGELGAAAIIFFVITSPLWVWWALAVYGIWEEWRDG